MKNINLRNRKSVSGFSLFLLITGLVLVLSGCYPGDPLTTAESDVVTTFYKEGTDFTTKRTYAMPDTVLYIGGNDEIVDESGPFDDQILARIRQNLAQFDYEEVSDPVQADVLVTPAVTTSTWVSGGCMPWWNWWYPWGWCVPFSFTWQTGSIIIFMADGGKQTEEETLWFAGINGIMESSSVNTSVRINNNIDQAFEQSPYLADGK